METYCIKSGKMDKVGGESCMEGAWLVSGPIYPYEGAL